MGIRKYNSALCNCSGKYITGGIGEPTLCTVAFGIPFDAVPPWATNCGICTSPKKWQTGPCGRNLWGHFPKPSGSANPSGSAKPSGGAKPCEEKQSGKNMFMFRLCPAAGPPGCCVAVELLDFWLAVRMLAGDRLAG